MTIKRCEYVVISSSHAQKGRNVAPTGHKYRLVGSISCLEGCRTPSRQSQSRILPTGNKVTYSYTHIRSAETALLHLLPTSLPRLYATDTLLHPHRGVLDIPPPSTPPSNEWLTIAHLRTHRFSQREQRSSFNASSSCPLLSHHFLPCWTMQISGHPRARS